MRSFQKDKFAIEVDVIDEIEYEIILRFKGKIHDYFNTPLLNAYLDYVLPRLIDSFLTITFLKFEEIKSVECLTSIAHFLQAIKKLSTANKLFKVNFLYDNDLTWQQPFHKFMADSKKIDVIDGSFMKQYETKNGVRID